MPDPPSQKNIVRPVLVAALICDAAVIDPSSGKKTVIGIYDKIFTQQVPTFRSSYFYYKVTNAVGKYRLKIQQVLSSSREVVGGVDGECTISDKLSASDHFAFLQNVIFPKFGKYEFQLFFDDYLVGQSIIEVLNLSDLLQMEKKP